MALISADEQLKGIYLLGSLVAGPRWGWVTVLVSADKYLNHTLRNLLILGILL